MLRSRVAKDGPSSKWSQDEWTLIECHNWAGNTAAINTRFVPLISFAALQIAKKITVSYALAPVTIERVMKQGSRRPLHVVSIGYIDKDDRSVRNGIPNTDIVYPSLGTLKTLPLALQ